MGTFNTATTRVFDLILAPFSAHPWPGVVAVSLLTGFLLLLIFRYTSNQLGIRAAKDLIISHLLEVLLYRDELRVVMRAQGRLAKDNLRYLGHALVPLMFMIPPVLVLLVQMDLRYSHRPLRVGEPTILAVKLRPGDLSPDQVSLSVPPGVAVETSALRMPAVGEVDWRLRAEAPGQHRLVVKVGRDEFEKLLVVGEQRGRVSPRRVGTGLWQQFLNPGEPPLPGDGPLASVSVSYSGASLPLFGWRLHWIWLWLVISMAFGYAVKGPLRVQV
jgi:hypothetical protein